MQTLTKRNPAGQGGASGVQTIERGLSLNHADLFDRMQRRLSGFALALDAVLPDVGWLQHVVEVAARGDTLPQDAPQRLYRLALKLHDLRMVLEVAE